MLQSNTAVMSLCTYFIGYHSGMTSATVETCLTFLFFLVEPSASRHTTPQWCYWNECEGRRMFFSFGAEVGLSMAFFVTEWLNRQSSQQYKYTDVRVKWTWTNGSFNSVCGRQSSFFSLCKWCHLDTRIKKDYSMKGIKELFFLWQQIEQHRWMLEHSF